MITLEFRIGGNGPAFLNFSSGSIAAIHLVPPGDGSNLGVIIGELGMQSVALTSANGNEGKVAIDINEGPDPVWLALNIDCRNGGAVSVGFAGSPRVRVDPGSSIGLEYD
ncbi:MAG: hypothetical protein EOP87_13885, partial [Verrucomicrobiaceae bacterium]